MPHRKATQDAKSGPIMVNDLEETEEIGCGLGSWRPQWLRRYGTAKFFVFNFCLVGILQGALFTYLIGIMSTIEKRFAFETKVSGIILIADNLSQMVVSPLVGFLGTKYNRAHLIGIGELVVASACLISAIPFAVYGPGLHLLNKEFTNASSSTNSYDLCLGNGESEHCGLDEHTGPVYFAVAIFFFASFANGFGYAAFYTVGLPFIDDSVKKNDSAVYLSGISTIRLLGPCLGFVLSSICLSFYEDPFMDPGITSKDPRWVGAWWLGFLILGVSIIIVSIPMFFFPKQFKELSSSKVSTQNAMANLSVEGVKASFSRLSSNYLLMFHVCGGVFRIIGYFGYYIIKPKYIELQYRKSASMAAFYTGATSVVTMAVGTMIGGLIIRCTKPRARYIALFVCIVETFSSLGIFSAMFLNCETPHFSSPFPALTQSCNSGCSCTTKVFQPVCASDGVTNYFSPCFAGCRQYDSLQSRFTDCSCAGAESSLTGSSWATNSWCPRDCSKFPIFLSILSMCNLVASTARTGDTLLTFRSVEPQDKSIAMGIIGCIFALFAFIPYPIIFGYIIDSTCLVWEKTCGTTGNCWLYDIDAFRVYFHSAAVTFILIGIAFEVGTVILAGSVKNMYEDEEEEVAEGSKAMELHETAKSLEYNGKIDTEKQHINGQH